MAIGTSQGAFYEDQFHYSQSQWDPKYDDNEITPNKQRTDKALEGAELDPSTGLGLDVGYKAGQSGKDGKYDTPLPEGDKGFQEWKSKYAPNDSGADYDLQGAYLGGAVPAENGHFPDTWKKPNHPTFSDQSKYYKDSPSSAGSWDGDKFIPPSMIHPIDYKTASPLVTITDEDIDKAMNIGMAAGPGILAGVASKTADVASRLKAAVMEGKGEHPETIRQETGWSKGSDGRARYEISDEGMKLVDKDWEFGETGKLPDFVEHPDLYKAYPHLKDMNFEVAGKDFPYIGGFNSVTNTIHVNPSAIKSGDEGILDVISHELQHAVQTKEGFTGGSNPNVMFDKITQALRGKILDNVKDMESMKPLMRLYKDIHENARKFTDFMYESVPGEVESNLTMNRRKLTTQQRKEFSPEDTQKMLEGQYNGISGGKYRAPIDLSDVM